MMRKKLVAISSLFMMLSFSSLTYAGSCPGSAGCPIDASLLAALKAQGVPLSEIVQANHYFEVYAVKLSKSR
jgi:hypothetical protein